jgi:hypothetical protein
LSIETWSSSINIMPDKYRLWFGGPRVKDYDDDDGLHRPSTQERASGSGISQEERVSVPKGAPCENSVAIWLKSVSVAAQGKCFFARARACAPLPPCCLFGSGFKYACQCQGLGSAQHQRQGQWQRVLSRQHRRRQGRQGPRPRRQHRRQGPRPRQLLGNTGAQGRQASPGQRRVARCY